MNYLDTSALIKRFVAERGSGLVDALVSDGQAIATAKIAYAEVHSELKKRLNEPITFAAADRPLLRAARSEGLAPLDVEAGAN